jgi:molybdopterin-containing oxidoreductase family iron-sulfur binding subunit
LSRHFQVESVLSLTGSRADERVVLAPAEILPFVSHLAARLARRGALDGVRPVGNLREATSAVVDRLVETLWATRGRSLVACGSQDVSVQAQCILVNQLLGNYGSTIDLERPSFQRSGNDRDAAALQDEIRSGGVAALFVGGVNPVYDLPGGEAFAAALEKVPLSVSFSERDDETASLATFVCPDRHFLETWADAEPVAGVVSVTQPVIRPLGDTRPIVESLATWTNTPIGAREILRRSWERHVYPRRRSEMTFDQFWEAAVHDGYVEVNTAATAPRTFSMPPPPIAPAGSAAGDGLSLVLYAKTALLDGRHAHNAWLQELPDPVSKVAWDNYACLSPATAARFQLETGDIVGITAEDGNRSSVDLPVLVQPGQHDGVVAIALGYGRRGTDRFARVGPQWFEAKPGVGDNGLVGVNAAPLLDRVAGVVRYAGRRVLVAKSGRHRDLAATQSHDSIMVPARLAPAGAERRPTVEETTLDAYAEDPTAGAHHHEAPGQDLWPQDHTYGGHRWGMAIDLNACTGCSACVISCQAENNIPVVGRDEVLRHREMHWIRIDRYYAGSDASPDVLHQPMLCQHCENAPCEVVCPVLATVHSSEGLNQQIYNRCVGTRYCANNCPYKVRRFNWFDYPHEDRLQNLVLNPDVTVRSRGVMEKCSFCIQRIQDAKLEAKRRGESLQDGEVQTACQQSCPARAIVFGDLNNPSSEVARLTKGPRSFRVLEELNVRPSVSYLRMVRNRAKSAETEHG